jgi:hypothetical protein
MELPRYSIFVQKYLSFKVWVDNSKYAEELQMIFIRSIIINSAPPALCRFFQTIKILNKATKTDIMSDNVMSSYIIEIDYTIISTIVP